MKSSDMIRALAPEDQAAEEDSVTAIFYPLRFLGMGLLIAWLCCTHVISIFPGDVSDPSLRTVFDIGMRFGDIGTFLVLAALAPRIGRLGGHRALCAAAVTLTVAGTAVIGLVLIPGQASEPLIAVLSAATAIGGAVLFCLWAEVYCQMGGTQTIVYGALSCITAAVVAFVISTMVAPFAIVATALLPGVSLVCVLLSLKVVPAEHATPDNIRFPIPWKLVALMAVAGFTSGLAGSLLPEANAGAVHRVIATGLAGAVILASVFALKERCDVRFLARVVLPVGVLAFALVPFVGPAWGYAVSFLIKLAFVWFTFFVLLMLANISYRYEVPSLRLFALARAASEGAIFAGVMLRHEVRQTELLTNDVFLYAVAVVGIVTLVACTLLWRSEQSVNADWGASGIGVGSSVHVPGPREQFMIRCEQLGERYGLTARETEILGLIAQRKSRVEIEQELFLSQNTVKTHIRHLYAKLGVHSKTDVFELFE